MLPNAPIFSKPIMPTETKTCLTCRNNLNGRCKISNLDMYEFRFMEPKYGGCGESAVLWQPQPRYKPEYVHIRMEISQ